VCVSSPIHDLDVLLVRRSPIERDREKEGKILFFHVDNIISFLGIVYDFFTRSTIISPQLTLEKETVSMFSQLDTLFLLSLL
jgi:hypothetical protein